MNREDELLDFLSERGHATWKDVADAGLDANLLYQLCDSGHLERVGPNLYRLPNGPGDESKPGRSSED